jgi:hypothetical protein
MNEHTEKKHNMQSPEDRDSIIYQKGFSAGTEHSRSSPETIKKIAQMSEDITNLKVGMGEIRTDVKHLIKTLEDHVKEEADYRKAQDAYHTEIMKTKADKDVVDDLKDNQKWVVRSIIGIVISAVIGLIIVK